MTTYDRLAEVQMEGYTAGRYSMAVRDFPRSWAAAEVEAWLEGYREGRAYTAVLAGQDPDDLPIII